VVCHTLAVGVGESSNRGAPTTRANWVDTRLRAAILSGELAAGERLRGEHLSAEWGVSATPLREAFQRLAGEGMIVIEPQRGARVASVDAVEAAECYELRLLLDPRALRASMAAADPSYRIDVDVAHRRLASARRSIPTFLEAHRAFHLTLLSRCPNKQLLRLSAELHDRTQRYQVGGVRHRTGGDPAAEHAALTSAVLADDARRATQVLTAHLRETLAAVRRMSAGVHPTHGG
jgi:GntR family transcriptional regulator, carbon starvation induced regulator